MSLDGKVALVTGGARGLGQAIASAFAAQGAAVAIADLPARRHDVDEVAGRLPRAVGVSLDVTDSASIRAARPESIADAVVFLASPQADMITGITLPVDGGWTAW